MAINIEKLKTYLDSEEGKKKTDEFFAKLEERDKILEGRLTKLHKYLETNSLDKLMDRMVLENGEEWENKCYKKGCEPYPTNILSLIISYVDKYGKEPEEETWEDFLHSEMILENYKFQLFMGQGSFNRIYKKIGGKWEFFLQS